VKERIAGHLTDPTFTRRQLFAGALCAGLGLVALRSDEKVQPTQVFTPSPVLLSTWVWHPARAHSLLHEARRIGIARLLVWVPPGIADDAEAFASLTQLVNDARQLNVSVDALGGDPSWAGRPELAGAWAQEVKALGLAERLHLDIEPTFVGLSAADQHALARGLLTALELVGEVGLPLDVDVPMQFAEIGMSASSTLLQDVMRRCDGITVMAYRARAAAVLTAAQPSIAQAAASGTPVWVGVNLADPGEDLPTTVLTYDGGDVAVEVQNLIDGVTGMPEIAGVALHDSRFLAMV